jgi:hypothetical protein
MQHLCIIIRIHFYTFQFVVGFYFTLLQFCSASVVWILPLAPLLKMLPSHHSLTFLEDEKQHSFFDKTLNPVAV